MQPSSSRSCEPLNRVIFEAVSDATSKVSVLWEKLCGVTTDGTPAMTGKPSGMASLMCSNIRKFEGEVLKLDCSVYVTKHSVPL